MSDLFFFLKQNMGRVNLYSDIAALSAPPAYNGSWFEIIFSRQASLARQTFLITPLHGARYKTVKTLTPKSSAM